MTSRVEEAVGELSRLYRGLSPRARRAVWTAVGVEAVLIAGVERDIQRRSADRVRGPKLLWRVIATQNVVGPALYLLFGRRDG
jgi:phytoene/squalene synthetase